MEAPPPPWPVRRPAGYPRQRVRDRVGILAVLLGALGLRLWHLGARSLWTDEGSSWTAATSSLRELIRLCAEKDASPPLFYLLTSLPMRLGNDEAHLRLVSALASLGLGRPVYPAPPELLNLLPTGPTLDPAAASEYVEAAAGGR